MKQLPKVEISFVADGKDFNLDNMTKLLEVQPSKIRTKDDWPDVIKNNPTLPERYQPRHSWRYSKIFYEMYDFTLAYQEILSKFKPKITILNELADAENIRYALLPTGTDPLEQANQRIINSLETTKHDLEKKLEKLLAFNGSSPTIFSEMNDCYLTLSQGLQQANSSFNPASGTFSIPKGEDLAWAKTATTKFNQRELDKLIAKPKLTKDDLTKLIQLVASNPDKEMPKNFWDKVSEIWNEISDNATDGAPLDFAALILETSRNATMRLGG